MNPSFPPGFMVIHSNRTELLVQLLGQWFQQYPLPPLDKEVILIQSNGMAQWLKMHLATMDGIAAGLDMLLPSRFVWEAYRQLLGPVAVPEISPFERQGLLWRLMRLLPILCQQPGHEPLKQFIQNDHQGSKLYQLSEKIADLFDQYLVYRADWLSDWAEHRDQLAEAQRPPVELEANQRWQAHLWRALIADIGPEHPSRALIHQNFLERTATLIEAPPGLPRRISVFGLSSLTAQTLDVLRALSRFTQVLLFVHNPCQHYWGDIVSSQDLLRRQLRRQIRKPGTPQSLTIENLHQHTHPLLAAWGQQGRDYLELLEELDDPERYRQYFSAMGTRIDLFDSPGCDTLLRQLQDDLLNLEPLPPAPMRSLSENDISFRFHRTHSRQREIEVLHDQLLALFNGEGNWHTRDILVMVPDISLYAPHIAAVFGRFEPQDPRYIPYSLADHTENRHVSLRLALDWLLNLPDHRLSVSDLMTLLEVDAVRQRFAISTDDLPLLQRWIRHTQIRWGLDEAHRHRFIAQPNAHNTWMQGMRQMLLGYAMGQDPTGREPNHWHDIEPYGDIAGLDATLAGSLARLLEKLQQQLIILSETTTPAYWYDRMETMLLDFFDCEDAEDTALLESWLSILLQWRNTCEQVGMQTPLSLPVVREHWLAQLDTTAPTQRFLAGRLTFATLLPMRAIPFRMICLLGLNDGDFPRHRPPVDFDLMARQMRPGDRSRREDDRYLFLEALLSARERYYLSWVGRSPQDNTECPPSVLVSQLRDYIDACWHESHGEKPSTILTTDHYLQPFHPAYFSSDSTHSPWFTYAHEWCQSSPHHSSPPSVLPQQIPDMPISLTSLISFLKNPARTFHRQRLKLYLEREELYHQDQDQEPFALDRLEQWSLQQSLIEDGKDACQLTANPTMESVISSALSRIEQQLARRIRRGELPAGAWGTRLIDGYRTPLEPLLTHYAQCCQGLVRSPDLILDYQPPEIPVPVEGLIDNLWESPTTPTEYYRIEFSASPLFHEKTPRHDKLLAAWVHHLAGQLALCNTRHQNATLTTWVIGLDNQRITFPPLKKSYVIIYLDALAHAHIQNLSKVLPLAAKTGFAWLKYGGLALSECKSASERDAWPPLQALNKARSTYEGGGQYPGESGQSPDLARAFPSFDHLWAEGAMADACQQLYAPLRHILEPNS